MTVEELIQKLQKMNPKAKVFMAVSGITPTLESPNSVCYFNGLADWSDHFDPDPVGGQEDVFICD